MSTPITVAIAQINTSFAGADYLPLVAGYLRSYAETHCAEPARLRFRDPLYRRLPVEAAVAQLKGADVVGFSLYVWNERLSLSIARALKAADPDVLIVCGGPQVPDKAEAFLRRNPFVDIAVHGEGEKVFADLLDRYPARDWEGLAGASRIDADGTFRTAPKPARVRDLEDIPSPYLNGIFDSLMARHPDQEWLVLWETNRGCPFSCTFCDWGSATQTKVNQAAMGRLTAELDWVAAKRIAFMFCCDANFGILKRDLDLARYAAAVKARTGFPEALSVQNTKNATDRAYETQKILSDAGLNKGVTLSMQSVHAPTLEYTKRANISLDTYATLQHRFSRDGVATYSDLIIALPGETYESFADGVATLIDGGQHNRIQFANLSILPNAEMADPAYRARFGFETVVTPILNMHGALSDEPEETREMQELVVATATMPRADWRRARAFAWMTAFLHFDKLMQIPLIAAREAGGPGYRRMIEAFLAVDGGAFPTIGMVRDHFLSRAAEIQAGGSEFFHMPAWLDIWWPDDEAMFIRLVTEDRLEAFYDEAGALLEGMLEAKAVAAVRDAVAVNRAMVNRPGQLADIEVVAGHDVVGLWKGALGGVPATARKGEVRYRIRRAESCRADMAEWCRHVVWYGNKKGAYLFPAEIKPEKPVLAKAS